MAINEKDKNKTTPEHEELQTEGPLSEKDEVKKAEDRTAEAQRSNSDDSVTGDLKNREH
jgi:hypothetical protein